MSCSPAEVRDPSEPCQHTCQAQTFSAVLFCVSAVVPLPNTHLGAACLGFTKPVLTRDESFILLASAESFSCCVPFPSQRLSRLWLAKMFFSWHYSISRFILVFRTQSHSSGTQSCSWQVGRLALVACSRCRLTGFRSLFQRRPASPKNREGTCLAAQVHRLLPIPKENNQFEAS